MARARRSRSSNNALPFVFGVLILLAAGCFGVWHMVSSRVLANVTARADAYRAAGYDVSWSNASRGGFPLGVTLAFDASRVQAPEGPDQWSWRVERVNAGAPIFDPASISLTSTGRHFFTLPGLGDVVADIANPLIRARVTGGTLVELDATSEAFTLARPALGEILFEADAIAFAWTPEEEERDARRMTARVANPRWVDLRSAPPDSLTLHAVISQTHVFDTGATPDAWRAWSADGGVMDVQTFEIDWGEARIGLEGSLSLSAGGDWTGELTLTSDRPGAVIEKLVENRVIDPLVGFSMGVIFGRSEDFSLTVPVRDGAIHVMDSPVITLPRVF